MKKVLATIFVVLLAVCFMVSCAAPAPAASSSAPASSAPASSAPASSAVSSAPASSSAAPGPSFTPAAQIKIPFGKKPFALPVDQASPKPIKIAGIGNDLNEFSLLVKEGINWAKAALGDRNCAVDYYGLPVFDVVQEQAVMRDCITKGYAGISCFGFSDAMQPVIKEAVDAGVVVCTWNTDAGTGSARNGYFGEDTTTAAKRLGEFAMDALKKAGVTGGKYAVQTGNFSVVSHEMRRKGFESVFSDPAWQLISETENQDKAETAYSQAQAVLLANPDLKFIYIDAGGPEGGAKAIQDAGKGGKVMLFCHDWTQQTVLYAKAGIVSGCIDQDPFNQGAAPLICMYNYIVGKVPIKDINYFSGGILTPDNVKDYYPN